MSRRNWIIVAVVIFVVVCVIALIINLLISRKPALPTLTPNLVDSGNIQNAQIGTDGLIYTKSSQLKQLKGSSVTSLGVLSTTNNIAPSFNAQYVATTNATPPQQTVLTQVSNGAVVSKLNGSSFGWIDNNNYLIGNFNTKNLPFATDAYSIPQIITAQSLNGTTTNKYTSPNSMLNILLNNTEKTYISTTTPNFDTFQIVSLNHANNSLQVIHDIPNFGFKRYDQFNTAMIKPNTTGAGLVLLVGDNYIDTNVAYAIQTSELVSKDKLLVIVPAEKSTILLYNLSNKSATAIANLTIPNSETIIGTFFQSNNLYLVTQRGVYYIDASPIQEQLQ